MNVEQPELLTPAQVAELLLVHPVTLARWRQERRGPPWIEVESQIRYADSAVRAYLASRTQGPHEAA